MKKALVILLILAVAGGVFAQVTFTGHIRGGLGVVLTDADGWDPAIGVRDVSQTFGTRVDLQAAWQNADGIAGFKVLLRGITHTINMEGMGFTAVSSGLGIFPHLYQGWFKAFNGMLYVVGGKVDEGGTMQTAGGIDTNLNNRTGTGMYVAVLPMPGLEFNVSIFPQRLVAWTYGANAVEDNGFATANYSFGVRYLVTDIVDIIGLGQSAVSGTTPAANDLDKPFNAALAFKVLALKSMGFSTFNLDFAFNDLTKVAAAKFMTIQLGQKIEYTAGDLLAGIRFMQQLRLYDNEPTTYSPDLTFTGYVQYLVNGNILPRLDAGFNVGTGVQTNGELRGQWDGTNKGGFTKDRMNFVMMPSVQFRFGSANQYIQLGYTLQMDLSKDSSYATLPAARTRNAIWCSYAVVF
ncbi:MAG: hypothetical protein FWD78_00385 [Treponema sp.]|nr:hypothetical protein [Treponema sp.]